MVAGRPVASDKARKKLRQPVLAPGRFASWAGVATIVARFSFTICQGGKSAGSPVTAAISLHNLAASSSRGMPISRSAPLMVMEILPGKAKLVPPPFRR